MTASVILRTKREQSLLRQHPWIFSGSIKSILNSPEPGETVEVLSSDGQWLGRGAFSPLSQIQVRIWTFEKNTQITPVFFKNQILRAKAFRDKTVDQTQYTAFRLINGESDGLPGIIVDRYNNFLVCQFSTMGAEFWKDVIIQELRNIIPCDGIFERSDVASRVKEGLEPRTGLAWGSPPCNRLTIREAGCRYLVDIPHGHKTGFYLDQRENRFQIIPYINDAELINCFSYTGGFCIPALKHGARHVTNIDASGEALSVLHANSVLNEISSDSFTNIEGNVFHELRKFRDQGREFDVIILDPPKFAESRSQIPKASRGYKDINLIALKLIRPNGILITFSCSGAIGPELFQKIIADAALDANRHVQIIRHLSQSSDHPVALNFPEGAYLKGLICRVI